MGFGGWSWDQEWAVGGGGGLKGWVGLGSTARGMQGAQQPYLCGSRQGQGGPLQTLAQPRRGRTLGEGGRTEIGGGLGRRAEGPGPDPGADLKKSREPPPAATVLMSSWGAWRVTPAVLASNTCSNSPA